MNLILLDWEKAFDTIYHEGLFSALERMNIHPKLINIIRQVYKKPMFKVEMEGNQSKWYQQETGIRQGCPLSQYLFLIVMTVMLHDIHKAEEIEDELEENRILKATFDEILYADDTIIFSTDADTVETHLHEFEKHAENYGLTLNPKKCETINTNRDEQKK